MLKDVTTICIGLHKAFQDNVFQDTLCPNGRRPFGCCSWNRCKIRNDNKDKALCLALRVKDIELIIDQLKFFFHSKGPYKYVTIIF